LKELCVAIAISKRAMGFGSAMKSISIISRLWIANIMLIRMHSTFHITIASRESLKAPSISLDSNSSASTIMHFDGRSQASSKQQDEMKRFRGGEFALFALDTPPALAIKGQVYPSTHHRILPLTTYQTRNQYRFARTAVAKLHNTPTRNFK
jgi:hypothetical protein